MSAAISRESRTSGVAVAQNMFTMSEGIIISSDILSDMVNILCRFKNLHPIKDSCEPAHG